MHWTACERRYNECNCIYTNVENNGVTRANGRVTLMKPTNMMTSTTEPLLLAENGIQHGLMRVAFSF